MFRKMLFSLIAGLTMAAQGAMSATYYVAPIGAVITGTPDGSLASPWPSISAALRSGKLTGGDTVLLMDGVHGNMDIGNAFPGEVTFMSQNERLARVERIYLNGNARNVTIRNLKVWATDPLKHESTLVYAGPGTSDILLDRLDVRAGQDAYNYPSWTAAEWAGRTTNGIMLDGTRQQVRRSNVTGGYFGIVFGGTNNSAIANRVDGFAGDGMRGNGNFGTFKDNIIENCVNIDGNHSDGFQSFSFSMISDLTLERNQIIEWTHTATHPLRCGLQGIAMFDGLYQNISIVNNIVAARNGHGITINGARNAQIINNTVVNIDGVQPGWPWIGIYPARDGTLPTDVLVANNLAMGYSGSGIDKVNRVYFLNNRIVRSIPFAFPGWRNFDYTLRPDSRFIDVATAQYAPALDVFRRARPVGAGPDLGAIEVGSGASAAPGTTDLIEPPPRISAAADAAELASVGTGGTTSTETSTSGAKFLTPP